MLKVITSQSVISYFDEQEHKSGFSYELLSMVSDSLHLALDITVENDDEKRIKRFKSGKYDVMLDLLPITAESRHKFLFANPILKTRLVLVEKAKRIPDSVVFVDNSILNFDTIYIRKTGFERLVLENMKDELNLNFEIDEIEGNAEQLCGMIDKGEIKYLALDEATVDCVLDFYSQYDLTYNQPLGFSQFYSWAVTDEIFKQKFDSLYSIVSKTESFVLLKNKYGLK